jgi:Asp-tRNA(Asn)/Glu-tRNA(Gln) amidotransferase A subunit family amidase
VAGPDASDPLALTSPFNAAPLVTLPDDALNGVRLGLVKAHVPRDQMSAEAVATWDRAVADLRAAGAEVVPFEPPVTLATYRSAFDEVATRRGDVPVNHRSPAPTANAYQLYFAGRSDEPRELMRRGFPAYRHYYDVLPETYEECIPLFDQPMTQDPAGQSFAKSRAEVVAALAASMRAAGVAAMVYPTMPFNAFSLEEGWPDVRTALGYGNWLGLPEVSVPSGLGADGMPALNLSVVGLPGRDAEMLAMAHAYEREGGAFVAPAVAR